MPNQKRLTLIKKNKQGSALVFALIILSMMLTVAMSLSTAAVMQKKNASSTQSSVQAYQIADSGAQLALRIINQKITSLDIDQRRVLGAFSNCTNGVVAFNGGNLPANTTLSISFFNAEAVPRLVACNELIDTVASIHATAQNLNNVRAVELAVSKEASPVAWWKFDDSTGPTATDSSGNSFDGTLTNFPSLTSPWTTTGRLLGALNFDGNDDYVNTSFNPASSLGQSFTIESWVYPTEAANYRGIWGAHGASPFTGIVLQHNRGEWIASIGDGSTWHEIELGVFELNKWTHVAIVFEGSPAGSDGFLKGYINGGSGSSGSRTIAATISGLQVVHDPSFWIGRGHSDSSNRYFKGTIDDVKIFDYALSGREIYNDYRDGFFNCVGNLITGGSYYPGDETDPPENLNPVYDPIGTDRKCEFFCSDYFNWHDPDCLEAVCMGLPTNATGFPLPDPEPLKDKAYTYSGIDNLTVTCEFACNTDYVYYAPTNTCNTCTGSVPGNAAMYANDKDGLSANTPHIRSGSNTSANCEYECDDYYNWNGNNCENAAICTGLPANAVAFTDTGNQTPLKDKAYTFSSSYTPGDKCEFTCNSGYVYDSSAKICVGNPPSVEYLVVAGGGGGGMDMGGGGGGGGVLSNSYNVSINQAYTVTVGLGGAGAPAAGTNGQPAGHQYTVPANNGQNSVFGAITAVGGGRGGSSGNSYTPGSAGAMGGSGGGASGYNNTAVDSWVYCAGENGTCSFSGTYDVKYGWGGSWAYRYGVVNSISCNNATFGDPIRKKVKACYYHLINLNNALGGAGTSGQGNSGGNQGSPYYSGGGGGAGGAGASGNGQANGGVGYQSSITGANFYWGGGGGGAGHSITGGNGGAGGGGGGAVGVTSGGAGLNNGQAGGGGAINSWANTPGGNAGANTGGGGGGGSHYNANNKGGDGGSGIVVIRYPDNYIDSVTTGTVAYTHVNGFKIYTWTSSGSINFSTQAMATSCANILATGNSVGNGTYWIKPTGYTGAPFQVYCDMTTDGGGYTYLSVSGAITTFRATDNNSCKALGMNIVIPRTQAQFTALYAKYGAGYFATVPGVYGTTPGNYTGCIMRNPASYGTGCANWFALDGGKWWLADTTHSEPNGDYTPGCWLSMNIWTPTANISNILFNDELCHYSTSAYICSTNDK